MGKEIQKLIEKYNNTIKFLSEDERFKSRYSTKQTICVLREVIEDLKRLKNDKK